MKKYLSEAFSRYQCEHVGNIEVNEHRAMILSDPCYEKDLKEFIPVAEQENKPVVVGWLGTYLRNLKKGSYCVEVEQVDYHIASWVCREKDTFTYTDCMEVSIPVDSGKVGLYFAHSAFQNDQIPQEDEEAQRLATKWNAAYDWYTYMSSTSLNDKYINEMGVCTSSGWGDGSYPGYLYLNEHKEVVAVEVVFFDVCKKCGSDECDCDDICSDCGLHYESCTCFDEENED